MSEGSQKVPRTSHSLVLRCEPVHRGLLEA